MVNRVKHGIIRRYPPSPYKYTHLFYENVTWDGNIKKKLNDIQIVGIVLQLT